jgi:hypothetical protein
MGLFSKKKKEGLDIASLPDLPEDNINFSSKDELPALEENPEIANLPEIESNALPTLPNSQTGRNFNQEAIKSAVTEPPKINPSFEKSKFAPLKQTAPDLENKTMAPSIREPRTVEITDNFSPQQTKKAEPVFIRLDKFQTTVETFEEIKNKIIEIEELLKKTKEIKQQEEQELNDWEREIQIIKSRIDAIDKNIFNKLD